MRRLRAWTMRLLGPLTRARREREMAAEIESHLQLHIDDNLRAGMSPAEARRRALVAFGPVEAIKDSYRDRGTVPVFPRVAQDLRFATRLLRKYPGFSATVIATIALAVALNAAIFIVLNAAAISALPVPAGDRLLTVTLQLEGAAQRGVRGMRSMLSYPEFRAVRQGAPAFQGVTAFSPFNGVTLDSAEPRPINVTLTSCEYFDVLRVRAALGRTFLASDCRRGGTPAVVLGDALWRRSFDADPQVVGRVIKLNRAPFEVIGVAQAGFTGTQVLLEDAFVPLESGPTLQREAADVINDANVSWLFVVGRLGDDATSAMARANLDVLAARMTAEKPERRIRLVPTRTTLAGLPEIRTLVLAVGGVLTAAVALILLIACANIANLLLARSTTRRRELAVRVALGAGRRRLVEQLLTESLLLAVLGGAAGTLLGTWLSAVLVRAVLSHLPPGIGDIVFSARADWRVIAFALAVTSLTGLTFGLIPALRATTGRLDVREPAETGRPAGRRLQQVLVGVQVTVSLVLLVCAGLLARGLHRANTVDPGLAVERTYVVSFGLREAGYSPEAAAAFQRRAIDAVAGLPGAPRVAQAGTIPLSDQRTETRFSLPGSDGSMFLEFSQVSGGFFDALGLTFARGRTFSAAELASETAVIVTESTARRLWPGRDPLSEALVLDSIPRPVVGVIRDAQLSRLGRADTSFVFLPAGPSAQPGMRLIVTSDSELAPRALRETLRALDPQLAIDVARLSDNLELWRAPSRLFTAIAVILAATALLLACTGVFGTVAYGVSRRVREIGVRVALGADRGGVLRLIVRQGMRPVVIGLVAGLAGAAAAATVLESMLFGLSPYDPLAFTVLPATLYGVALLACYLPARRALAIDPIAALRAE